LTIPSDTALPFGHAMKKHNEIFSLSATLAVFVILGRTLYTTLAHEDTDLVDAPAYSVATEGPVPGSSLLQSWKGRVHPKQAAAHKLQKQPSQPQQPNEKTASLSQMSMRSQLLFMAPAGFSLVASCALVALISCIVSGGFGGDDKIGAGEKMLPPSLGEGGKSGAKESKAGVAKPQEPHPHNDTAGEAKAIADAIEAKNAGPTGGPESETSEAMKLAKAMIASKAEVAEASPEVAAAQNSEASEAMKLAQAMMASKANVAGSHVEAKAKQESRKPPAPKPVKKRSDLAHDMAAKAKAP